MLQDPLAGDALKPTGFVVKLVRTKRTMNIAVWRGGWHPWKLLPAWHGQQEATSNSHNGPSHRQNEIAKAKNRCIERPFQSDPSAALVCLQFGHEGFKHKGKKKREEDEMMDAGDYVHAMLRRKIPAGALTTR
jgi:hypothetical protein